MKTSDEILRFEARSLPVNSKADAELRQRLFNLADRIQKEQERATDKIVWKRNGQAYNAEWNGLLLVVDLTGSGCNWRIKDQDGQVEGQSGYVHAQHVSARQMAMWCAEGAARSYLVPQSTLNGSSENKELAALWEIRKLVEKLLCEEAQGRIQGSTFDELRVALSEYHQ